jgi:transposase
MELEVSNERMKYSREFKLEAVNLVRKHGVAIVQAARDLDLNHNVLRRWLKEHDGDPKHAYPGLGLMKPEQLEIDRLRKEVTRLNPPQPTSRGMRYKVRIRREAPVNLACGMGTQSAGCFNVGLS